MKVIFISNFINHHQVHLADELYAKLGDDYKFIETEQMPDSFVSNGYPDYSSRPYVLKAYLSPSIMDYAKKCTYDADVVVIGSAPEFFVSSRIKDNKLTFRYHERWFKAKPWFLTGPKGWIHFYKYHIRYRRKPLYMLCASAFTARDVNTIGAYKNKCFKWGYFTKTEDLDYQSLSRRIVKKGDSIRIMWCARFIKLKHPELPIQLASRLKNLGYKFSIDMFGAGEILEDAQQLAKQLDVCDCVKFKGTCPNYMILQEMKDHDIFLFTSDRNEGWGAVLNEAMSCGCAVVGSDQIGSVPFLIKDGMNGLVFKSECLNSLESKVRLLLDDPIMITNISKEAYYTLKDVWSPSKAASNLFSLIDAIKTNDSSSIPGFGPGSVAK